MTEQLQVHPLFGGAIELAKPQRLVDVSDFRPVPDHQEVFADGATDQSLLVEILERQPQVPDAVAARHFFDDLATANDATSSSYDSDLALGQVQPEGLPPDATVVMGLGQQQVSKGRQGPEKANQIQLAVAVVRLPSYGSEVLISLNTPVYISERSAAAEHAGAGLKTMHLTAVPLFQSIVSSLRIKDYGLFGAK